MRSTRHVLPFALLAYVVLALWYSAFARPSFPLFQPIDEPTACEHGTGYDPDLNHLISVESACYAVQRGERGGHVYVSYVDSGYRDVALNWLAVSSTAVSAYATIFATDDVTVTTLAPASARAYVPVNKTSESCNHFQQKWLLKHAIVLAVLRAARQSQHVEFVTWFDVDCIFLQTYHEWLVHELMSTKMRSKVDLIAQMGVHPRSIFSRVGATACLGLFTIRTSIFTLSFYESFWVASTVEGSVQSAENPTFSIYEASCKHDDQWAFNMHLDAWGGLLFDERFNVSLVTGAGLLFSRAQSSASHVRAIQTAFLPYIEFPRQYPESFTSIQDAKTLSDFEAFRKLGARVWHMPASKDGKSKRAAMQHDGVWALR